MMAQPPRPTAVPSLLESSLESLARHIDRCASLQPLPEELAQPLFARVLELGKLTPRVLRLFQDTQHEWVLQRIKVRARHIGARGQGGGRGVATVRLTRGGRKAGNGTARPAAQAGGNLAAVLLKGTVCSDLLELACCPPAVRAQGYGGRGERLIGLPCSCLPAFTCV